MHDIWKCKGLPLLNGLQLNLSQTSECAEFCNFEGVGGGGRDCYELGCSNLGRENVDSLVKGALVRITSAWTRGYVWVN